MSDTEQEINVNVSDADLLAEALGGTSTETVTQETATTEQPVVQDRARDEQGRFARKEEQATLEVSTQTQAETQKEDAHVPSWRLREVSESRRAAEKRAEEAERRAREFEAQLQVFQRQQQPQQPKTPISDLIFDNPEAAIGQAVNPLLEPVFRMAAQAKERADRLEAASMFSREDVEAAEKAFNAAANSGRMDPNEHARINGSPNPFAAAVEWHKRNTILSEVGTDPNAWLEKKLEERLNDPAFLAKAIERVRGGGNASQGTVPSNVTRLPPSLNKAAGAATRNAEEFDDSDRGLLSVYLPR